MPASNEITEHCARFGDHRQFYLACGPEDGPLIVFVHGWPELSWSWRHQLPALAALGFRAVAPDMRGYGRSTCYRVLSDYAQQHVVGDMLKLLDAMDRRHAIWVGHDWGSPTVWSIASHHPERCDAVASLCVPYQTLERGLDALIELIDRTVYPQHQFPAGQWDYQRFYEESFELAVATMEGNIGNTVKALFRKGNVDALGKPAGTAMIRAGGGWFGGANAAPDLPRDDDVISSDDHARYTAALTGSGFFGPDAYYMNHAANAEYSREVADVGILDMPVLFIHARFDSVCETLQSELAQPMRAHCTNLTEEVVESGHWMAQECPREVNAALVRWLATVVPGVWPTSSVLGTS